MFKEIITLLNKGDYHGVSVEIDIAKGINKAPDTFKESKDILKRKLWQLSR